MIELLTSVFEEPLTLHGNFAVRADQSRFANQGQTNDVFSDKWEKYDDSEEKERLYQFQLDWYLKLYGFASEQALKERLSRCRVIFDAGTGLGYKAAWFARLAPHALVIGMDFSSAARVASEHYRDLKNLYFIQGDIAATGFRTGAVDWTSCDQVIMHTEDPEATFAELARVTNRATGEFACYFYAKKALPRELIDDHFRLAVGKIDRDDLWAMSRQVTELGRRLSELKVEFDCPDIPLLGIKGGRYDVQRFLYWNFLKCFWNAELGPETSLITNFDWYSPSNARRFSEAEVRGLVAANGMEPRTFHAEEACYSGTFVHRS